MLLARRGPLGLAARVMTRTTAMDAPATRKPLLFQPSESEIARTQMTAFVAFVAKRTAQTFADAEAFHRFSVDEAPRFWELALEFFSLDVAGQRAPSLVGTSPERARFFPGLRLSFAKNLLRCPEVGDSERLAIISVDESGARRELTRGALARDVLAVASGLAKLGIGAGDRVVAIAANTAESVIACLATLAVGASWSSVAPNLGADATLDRFGQLSPKLLFAHSNYRHQGDVFEVGERVRHIVHALGSIEHVVALGEHDDRAALERLGDRAMSLADLRARGAVAREGREGFRDLDQLPLFPFDHPTYVLFSSGTTGRPKCIVHGAGGTLIEHVKEHRLHSDLRPGDRLFFQTAAGWMMWNWLVSALASQVTIVLYEGSVTHPAPDALWRLVSSERVHVFGTSPGYLQFSREGEIVPKDIDLGSLRAIQSTGSVLSDDLFHWVVEQVKAVPVQSISGGTDIIGCFLLGHPNLPVVAGELQAKSLGYDVDALGHDGKSVVPGEGRIGELVCKNPFPSRPIGLFDDESGERFHAAYFSQNEGVWTHGDLLEPAPHGGGRIHGRSDGVLNILGIRIGPAEIYRALEAGVPEVAEAMAVEQASPNDIGGSRLVLLVVVREGVTLDVPLQDRIRRELHARCSAAHVPAVIVGRRELPTTHSGKRSERAARDAVNRRPVENLSALRNPESLSGLDTLPELSTEHGPALLAGPSHDVSIEDVRAIWKEVLGLTEIHDDDAFFHLGGHSLAAVSLLARIEKAFGARLPMSSLLAKASTPARMVAVLASEAERHDTHLVAIRPEGKKTPVFWLPGGGGLSVLAFREVSMRLGEDQPVYGFEAKLSLDDAPASIPAMAKRYVDDLIAAFPDGPYLLFGFSFGSWVAFEMAVELRARNRDVPLVCVFDASIPSPRSASEKSKIIAQRAAYHAKNLARTPPARIPEYIAGTASVAARRVREQLAKVGLNVDPRYTTERSADTVFDQLDRRNRAAAATYVREPLPMFDGRITVVLAKRTSQSGVSPALDDRLTIGRHATHGLEVHRVEGSHLSMLEPPEVDGLAEVLRGCIERATSAPRSSRRT